MSQVWKIRLAAETKGTFLGVEGVAESRRAGIADGRFRLARVSRFFFFGGLLAVPGVCVGAETSLAVGEGLRVVGESR